jgi:hypothetical protein
MNLYLIYNMKKNQKIVYKLEINEQVDDTKAFISGIISFLS